jgi:Glycoside hydrolase family 5 C-terminal domain/Cellulase (glycosyl hydrolase family 5)
MIHTQGPWFVDEHDRTLLLRGVNLAGSSKNPIGFPTRRREGFFDHRRVSFVGRPFPIEEADEHFARLREWGLTFVRLLVTWEAIEHAGPGQYDEAYLDYLVQVIEKARQHHIRLFIDPHQDVWGRLSGGDGAPGWTYEAVGFKPENFTATGAAIVHAVHGDPFPRMVWPSNYTKLAAATMFTLFFGGNDFAPHLKIEGEPAQEYLQRHFIDALKQVAQRVKDLPNIAGFDSFNEPSTGYIGVKDLMRPSDLLSMDAAPTPFESMLLGAGFARQVAVYQMSFMGPRKRSQRLINPQGARAWQAGADCIWKQHGVWEVDDSGQPRLLKPDYFSQLNGRAVDPTDDYLRPFIRRFAREIRSIMPRAVIFAENVAVENSLRWTVEDGLNVVNAAHWYDVLTLYFKKHITLFTVDPHTRRFAFGPRGVRLSFVEQLHAIKQWGIREMNQAPTVIGEFGVPFDLKKKQSFRTGDFGPQTRALDSYLDAMDANLLNWTLWNYTPDNDNRWGDQWNDEDLSIFSRDQQTNPSDIHSGGRALDAVVRPYARAIAGEPLHMKFDRKTRHFEFEFRHHADITAPTEILVPNYQYPHGYQVEVSDGAWEIDRAGQVLLYRHSDQQEVHRVRVWS